MTRAGLATCALVLAFERRITSGLTPVTSNFFRTKSDTARTRSHRFSIPTIAARRFA